MGNLEALESSAPHYVRCLSRYLTPPAASSSRGRELRDKAPGSFCRARAVKRC